MSSYGQSKTFFVTGGTSSQCLATTAQARIFSMHIISDGTAGIVTIKSGGSGGTTYIQETGTVSTGKTINFGFQGILLPAGAYVTADSHATTVAVTMHAEVA